MSRLEELTGVLPALISPLSGDGKVDEPAVIRLVEHVIGGGVDSPPALGSTGETASLYEDARSTPPSSVGAGAGRAAAAFLRVAHKPPPPVPPLGQAPRT